MNLHIIYYAHTFHTLANLCTDLYLISGFAYRTSKDGARGRKNEQ